MGFIRTADPLNGGVQARSTKSFLPLRGQILKNGDFGVIFTKDFEKSRKKNYFVEEGPNALKIVLRGFKRNIRILYFLYSLKLIFRKIWVWSFLENFFLDPILGVFPKKNLEGSVCGQIFCYVSI